MSATRDWFRAQEAEAAERRRVKRNTLTRKRTQRFKRYLLQIAENLEANGNPRKAASHLAFWSQDGWGGRHL